MDFESFENFLEEIEGQCNPAIEKVRNRNVPTFEERKKMALYLAKFHKRLPAYRQKLQKMLPASAEKLISDPKTYEDLKAQGIAATPELVRQAVEGPLGDPSYTKMTHLNSLGAIRSSGIMDALLSMDWRLYVAPGGVPFISSDNPIFYFEHLGLKNERAEVTFPVSSEVCLVLSHHRSSGGGLHRATPRDAHQINRRTASQAVAQVYAKTREEWIVNLLNRDRHLLRYLFPPPRSLLSR
jgi:hypothetical protein